MGSIGNENGLYFFFFSSGVWLGASAFTKSIYSFLVLVRNFFSLTVLSYSEIVFSFPKFKLNKTISILNRSTKPSFDTFPFHTELPKPGIFQLCLEPWVILERCWHLEWGLQWAGAQCKLSVYSHAWIGDESAVCCLWAKKHDLLLRACFVCVANNGMSFWVFRQSNFWLKILFAVGVIVELWSVGMGDEMFVAGSSLEISLWRGCVMLQIIKYWFL